MSWMGVIWQLQRMKLNRETIIMQAFWSDIRKFAPMRTSAIHFMTYLCKCSFLMYIKRDILPTCVHVICMQHVCQFIAPVTCAVHSTIYHTLGFIQNFRQGGANATIAELKGGEDYSNTSNAFHQQGVLQNPLTFLNLEACSPRKVFIFSICETVSDCSETKLSRLGRNLLPVHLLLSTDLLKVFILYLKEPFQRFFQKTQSGGQIGISKN